MFKSVLESKGKKAKKATDKKTLGKRDTANKIKKCRKQRRKEARKVLRKANIQKMKATIKEGRSAGAPN